MNYADVRAALRAGLERLDGLEGRVHGLSLELGPNVTLVVASKQAIRNRRYRAKLRDGERHVGTLVERHDERHGAPSLSGFPPEVCSGLGSGSLSAVPKDLTGSGEKTAKSAARKRPAKARAAKTTRVPIDWKPQPEHVSIAQHEGVTLGREEASFRDWEFRTPRSDWDAAFRGWLRRSGERQRGNGRGRPAPRAGSDMTVEQMFERIAGNT